MVTIKSLKDERDAARKERNEMLKETIVFLLTVCEKFAKDKRVDVNELTAREVESIIETEVKKNKKALVEIQKSGRKDLIDKAKAEIKILEGYLPDKMTIEQIKVFIIDELQKLGIENPTTKEKGTVMKTIMPLLKGKADGSDVNTVVTMILT